MRTDLKKARNGVIAAALGAALLMGGGTYALWTTSASVGGGEITAGNMTIDAGETAAYDISATRVDKTANAIKVGEAVVGSETGAPIGDNFLIVPGDTVILAFGYTVFLEGTNLKATLSLGGLDSANGTNGFEHLALAYALYQADGTEILPKTTLDTPLAADVPLKTLTPDDSGDIVFVLYATFEDITDTVHVYDGEAVFKLTGAVEMKLEQARP